MTNAVFERLTGSEPQFEGISRFIYVLLNVGGETWASNLDRRQNIKLVRPELLRNQRFRPFCVQGGIKLKNYEIKQAFKNLPDAGLPDNESVTCREYEQCDGCNYPAHGLICWHGDGKCLRTEMQEVKK